MMTTTDNLLLNALPEHERDRLLSLAERVSLPLGEVLYEQGDEVHRVHFLTSGAASMLVLLSDGRAIEPALVGREGVLGYPMGLGDNRARWRSVVQLEGEAFAIPVGDLASILREPGELGPLLMHYTGLLVAFVAQSTACTQFHEIRQRASRWLLLMHDRAAADEFPITHEWLAYMLGTSRPAMTHELGLLADEGLLVLRRGAIRVSDRAGLEAVACECYAQVQDAFAELASAPSERATERDYRPSGQGEGTGE